MSDDRTFSERVRRAALGQSTFAQLRAVERERDGVREELARQDTANEDLRATLAMRTRALAASQQDLTRMEAAFRLAEEMRQKTVAERDWARQVVDMLRKNEEVRAQVIRERNAERDSLKAEAAHWRATAEQYLTRLGEVGKDLGTARYQNRLLSAERAWQVARQDTGIACSSCTGPIVRGQAFQPLADAKGFFAHCCCPISNEEKP